MTILRRPRGSPWKSLSKNIHSSLSFVISGKKHLVFFHNSVYSVRLVNNYIIWKDIGYIFRHFALTALYVTCFLAFSPKRCN